MCPLSGPEAWARSIAPAADHPYICKIFEIGEAGGDALFLAMEYITGETLQRRLQDGPLPLSDALRLAGEIAEALQEAHARRFLHRDLKPANIMLTEQGHVKVMDFGLAKRVEDLPSPDQATGEIGATQLTAHGSIVGIPDYMSPEQVKGVTLIEVQEDHGPTSPTSTSAPHRQVSRSCQKCASVPQTPS